MKKAIIFLSLISSAAFAAPTYKTDSALPALVQQEMAKAITSQCPTAFDFGTTDIVEAQTVSSRAREDRMRYATAFQVVNPSHTDMRIAVEVIAYGNVESQPDSVAIVSIKATNNLCQ